MPNLNSCPSNIHKCRDKRIVYVLISFIGTLEVLIQSNKRYQKYYKTSNIPGCPLSFVINHVPNRVWNLSERYPIAGVAIPSTTCPTTIMVAAAGVLTTLLR